MRGAAGARASLLETWGRRAVSIPLYTILCLVAVTALPVLLGVGAIVDLLRGSPWVVVRCLSFFAFYLCCEVVGILASLFAWVFSGVWAGRRQRFQHWNFALECWWARTLLRGAQRIFGMRIEVEGLDEVQDGPIILFIRHASVGDTLLPAVLISDRYGLVLRYVLKRELLWDPCLDIVGNRLPNCFVRRGSGESAREVAIVQHLMEDLGPNDGVLIYPEGTRFTPGKRARVIARLAAGTDAALLVRARALRHVLPPRLGGPLALLARNQGADAVFCAHIGFDAAGTFRELLNGSLVGTVIKVCFWRVPCEAIPTDRAAQIEWLYDHWGRVDAWIQHQHTAAAAVSAQADH